MKQNMVYGMHPVENLLNSSIKIKEIFILKGLQHKKQEAILGKAKEKGIMVRVISDRKQMDQMADNATHQGIIAVLKTEAQYRHLDDFKDARTLVMLDHITDPGNFGAILRTCDLFQIDGVIIPQNRSCELNSTVIKASSGAAFFVPVIRVTNLSRALSQLKDWGFWSYATVGEEGEDIGQVDFSDKSLLILGSEGKGVSQKIREASDFKVTIPTAGHIDSLNVSVAAGISIYEVSRKKIQVQGG
jgi:23S rRNA (guanosine2251-2'-O)-methyltransferase